MKLQKIVLLTLILTAVFSGCSPAKKNYQTTDVSSLSLEKNTFLTNGSDEFKFVVFAHAYGNASVPDIIPSSNLTSHLDDLLAFQPNFFFSLGDMVRRPTNEQFDILQDELLSRIQVPIFNVVGNHDVMNRALYRERYGKTYYTFTYGNSEFIILDTEIDRCSILNDQLTMLNNTITDALADDSIDQIFIMIHKVLFLEEPLANTSPNDQVVFEGNNFHEILVNTLLPAAKIKPLYLFAGDVGAFSGNLSPYYHQYDNSSLYSYAAGIGDTDQDVVFIVSVTGKDVEVKPYRLVDGIFLNLDDYNLEYWQNYGTEKVVVDEIQPMKQKLNDCAVSVCRYAKNTFHLRCRIFLLLTAAIPTMMIVAFVVLVRRRKKSRKIN